MRNKTIYKFFMMAMVVYGCTKPYNPTTTSINYGYLVVEGIINTGTDSTKIVLSRTVTIANKNTTAVETKATVTVENAQGTSYPITETSVKGTYAAAPLNLDNTKQYRVRIKTSNGNTYLSALVSPKVTPPIDSVGYAIQSTGLQVYANTHDATNNTRYYMYTFRETWQFNARYPTGYISNGTALLQRTAAQQIFYCWGSDTSTNILINSTAALSQDVVYQYPISNVLSTSEKIESKYSILVTQFALTADAYSFWQNLQKNTEELGSIFDAQPSQLTGNISNIANPAEPVIGYISAGTTTQKRVYILKTALPSSWQVNYPYSCPIDTSMDSPPPCSGYPATAGLLIALPVHAYGLSPITVNGSPAPNSCPGGPGWLYTSIPCADCTIRGTAQQPAFWK